MNGEHVYPTSALMNNCGQDFAGRILSLLLAVALLASCGGEGQQGEWARIRATNQDPSPPGTAVEPAEDLVTPSDEPPVAPVAPAEEVATPSQPVPDSTPAGPAPTTLSASVSKLTLSVEDTLLNAALTGTPRSIVVTNTGSATALNISYSTSPALPAGTTASSTCTAALTLLSSCTITLTPGAAPTAAPGDVDPAQVAMTIEGSNTNTLTSSIDILTYGSVHQGGYAFDIDDTTPATGSIGGKVAALSDIEDYFPWSPRNDVTGATSLTDGAVNTAVIAAFYGEQTPPYAAGVCSAVDDGFTDWYLPALCEMGTGQSCPLNMQNIRSSLTDNFISGAPDGMYWTSSESLELSEVLAWQQNVGGGPGFAVPRSKPVSDFVRCARILTD